jgi:hypothetical protein
VWPFGHMLSFSPPGLELTTILVHGVNMDEATYSHPAQPGESAQASQQATADLA